VFLFDAVRTRCVQPEVLASIDPQLLTLRNLNTHQDYLDALSTAGSVRRPDCRRATRKDGSPAALPVILGYERAQVFAAQHRRRIAVQRGVEKPIG
jgi:hypothetical protein